MGDRATLQKALETFLGTRNVYFQPPESLKIQYPCIIYKLDGDDVRRADNKLYKRHKRYSVMYVTKAPDDAKADSFLEFPYSSFDRHYTADNLNHFVYTLFY